MINAFHKWFARLSTWPVMALLFIAYLLCTQGFSARHAALGYELRLLDVRFGYTPEDARRLFEALGASGRNLYALTEVTLDLVFPFVYGGLLALLVVNLFSRERTRFLVLIPVLGVVFDLLENFTVALLAWTFAGRTSPLAWAASAFSSVKLLLGALSLVIVLVGAVVNLRRKPHL